MTIPSCPKVWGIFLLPFLTTTFSSSLVSTRNGEIRDVSCCMSIIIKIALRFHDAKLFWLGGVVKDKAFGQKSCYRHTFELLLHQVFNIYRFWIMAEKKRDNRVQPLMKNKRVIKDLFVLWLALTALSCAAINLHISLNKLGEKEEEWPVTSGCVKKSFDRAELTKSQNSAPMFFASSFSRITEA